jgi:NitT/TauT family transport system substrate-binding protein
MTPKLFQRSFRFLVGAAVLMLAAHAPAFAQGTKPLVPVSLRLDWKPGGQHAPFFLGKARGFYAAEGIDLQIIAGSGSSDAVKQLGAGSIDLGVIDALVLVQAAEQGVPTRSIAAYYQRTPIVLLSPKSKPVTDPQQLLGNVKVGSKRASATFQGLSALLAVNKIDPKKAQLIDVGFGVQPLLVGQVDALMGFTMNEAIEAETGGMPVYEMPIADHGVQAYGLMLAASQKFLSAHADLAQGFVRATTRAVQASIAEPAAATAALAAATSETDAAREQKVLLKTVPYWFAKGDATHANFGRQTLADWQQTIETAKRVGLVETAPASKDLPASGFVK